MIAEWNFNFLYFTVLVDTDATLLLPPFHNLLVFQPYGPTLQMQQLFYEGKFSKARYMFSQPPASPKHAHIPMLP